MMTNVPSRTQVQLPTVQQLEDELLPPVRDALLESIPGAMAPEEADGAARRVIRGRGLPEELAARLGERPALTFVAFDADRIHGWVFASERVPVAGGASHLLEGLQKRVAELVRPVREITGVLYSAGGGGLLVARAVDGAAARGALEERVKRALEGRSAGLGFTVVAVAVSARDLAAPEVRRLAVADGRHAIRRGLPGVLGRVQTLVRRRKESAPDLLASGEVLERGESGELTPVVERCPSCNRRPPGESPVTGDEPRFWCGQCRELSQSWRRRQRERKARNGDDGPTPTFEDFAAEGDRGRGYLAFLAIDGNSMGSLLQRMGSLLELAAFSRTTTAAYDAARRRAQELLVARHTTARVESADEASLSLLSGGDEVSLVLPACAAPEVTVAALRVIEEVYGTVCADGGLLAEVFAERPELLDALRTAGAGAGVVCAASSYPARLLRRYANDLQRQAKRGVAALAAEAGDDGGGGEAVPRSSVAFLLLTDRSPLPEGVGSELEPEELLLARFEESLREAELAAEEGVPRAALQRLLAAWRQEEDGLAGLAPGAERDRVLARLGANFFRYQLARNPALAAWWTRVSGAPPGVPEPDGEDRVVGWLMPAGGRRLERLVELLALGAPVGDGGTVETGPREVVV